VSQDKSNTVRILNPTPGAARYTSRKNALRMVKRGIAALSSNGEAIWFPEQEWLAQLDQRDAASRMDDGFVEQRGGVLWWNGCDHRENACHKPGENVIFPKPDRAMPYFAAIGRR
jgi:hypothetical protein